MGDKDIKNPFDKYVKALLNNTDKVEVEFLVRRVYEVGFTDGEKVGMFSNTDKEVFG